MACYSIGSPHHLHLFRSKRCVCIKENHETFVMHTSKSKTSRHPRVLKARDLPKHNSPKHLRTHHLVHLLLLHLLLLLMWGRPPPHRPLPSSYIGGVPPSAETNHRKFTYRSCKSCKTDCKTAIMSIVKRCRMCMRFHSSWFNSSLMSGRLNHLFPGLFTPTPRHQEKLFPN